MIRFLLDTDILSLSERGDLSVRRHLAALSAEEIAVSLISAEEMMRGRLAVLSRRSQGERRVHAYQKLRATIRFLQSVQILSIRHSEISRTSTLCHARPADRAGRQGDSVGCDFLGTCKARPAPRHLGPLVV